MHTSLNLEGVSEVEQQGVQKLEYGTNPSVFLGETQMLREDDGFILIYNCTSKKVA
jgi:hypothetical protein